MVDTPILSPSARTPLYPAHQFDESSASRAQRSSEPMCADGCVRGEGIVGRGCRDASYVAARVVLPQIVQIATAVARDMPVWLRQRSNLKRDAPRLAEQVTISLSLVTRPSSRPTPLPVQPFVLSGSMFVYRSRHRTP